MSKLSSTLTFEGYDVLKQVGKGAYGVVFKVRSKKEKTIYALKTIDISKMDKKTLTNSLNEIRILCSIDHPNVVGYKEAFVQDTKLCVVMEYVGGGDLYERVTSCKNKGYCITEESIWKYSTQIMNGLKALHDLKIIHRDIKSANIFLSDDYETVKLGDLNVAKVAKEEYASTQIGTPYYLAPEIWTNERYDFRCDIFSMGCVMFEMAALEVPFEAANLQELFKQITKSQPARIPERYSDQLNAAIHKFLEKDPERRPNIYQVLEMPVVKAKISNQPKMSKQLANSGRNVLMETIVIPRNLNKLNDNLPKKEEGEIIKPGARKNSRDITKTAKQADSRPSSSKQMRNQKSQSKKRAETPVKRDSVGKQPLAKININISKPIPPKVGKLLPRPLSKPRNGENSGVKKEAPKQVPQIIPYQEYLNKMEGQRRIGSTNDVFYNPFSRS